MTPEKQKIYRYEVDASPQKDLCDGPYHGRDVVLSRETVLHRWTPSGDQLDSTQDKAVACIEAPPQVEVFSDGTSLWLAGPADADLAPVLAKLRSIGMFDSLPSSANRDPGTSLTDSPPNRRPRRLLWIARVAALSAATVVLFWLFHEPVVEFRANHGSRTQGEPLVLTWETWHTQSVSLSSSIVGDPDRTGLPTDGQITLYPEAGATYTLTARGWGGETTRQVQVLVDPKTPFRFTAVPTRVREGESSTLYWQAQGTDRVDIQPDVGIRKPAGSEQVTPKQTTRYVMTGTLPSGKRVAAEVRIEITSPKSASRERSAVRKVIRPAKLPEPAPSITLAAEPTRAKFGEPVTLRWSVEHASKVDIDNGIGAVSPSGSKELHLALPGAYSFTIHADGPGGRTEKAISLLIVEPPPKVLPQFLSVAIEPAIVNQCAPAKVLWTTSDAETVMVDDQLVRASRGSVVIRPMRSGSYRLKAQGADGMATAKVHVLVRPRLDRFGQPICGDIAWYGTASAGAVIRFYLGETPGTSARLTADSGRVLSGSLPDRSVAVSSQEELIQIRRQPFQARPGEPVIEVVAMSAIQRMRFYWDRLQ